MISVHDTSAAAAPGDLSRFRHAFYQCLTTRTDALFELTDGALCAEGPVTSLVELSLATEHRRGHGALYDGLNQGRIDINRFRNVVAGQQLPRCGDGRIMLAIDVSHWLRPDANTSPERLFCHTYARGKGQAQMIPGWPYSFVAALEPGRTSWTAILDVLRVRPDDEHTDLAATQLRTVIHALITAGHWQEGDPEIWIIGDSGYDGPGWRSCWPISRFRCWCGCAQTGCWPSPRHPDVPAPSGAAHGTEPGSCSPIRRPGRHQRTPRPPPPPATAPRTPARGIGCTPN
jgi:hypothetical protein